MALPRLSEAKSAILRRGGVIPAHPLALTAARRLDERRQRALTRYYLDAGVVGLAVGVHTTQFAIHEPKVGLLRPVLQLAIETATRESGGSRPVVVTVAGVIGRTDQALREAALAADLGYDLIMPQLGAFPDATDEVLIEHCTRLSEVRPLFGFYLQPAVGGRYLGYEFWQRFAEIENVAAIKIAPFNRYQTLDVVRGVAAASRGSAIALYTGNDDHIVFDLLTPFPVADNAHAKPLSIVGGLLGHWAVWTHAAVRWEAAVRSAAQGQTPVDQAMLRLAVEVTDANAALFDPSHSFRGSIAGIHEILRRQRLLEGRWCLDPLEDLSAGQANEIERVCRMYPHLTDDAYVQDNLDRWLN